MCVCVCVCLKYIRYVYDTHVHICGSPERRHTLMDIFHMYMTHIHITYTRGSPERRHALALHNCAPPAVLISTWLASTFTSVSAFFLLLRLGQYLDGRTGIEPGEFTRPALLLAFFLGFLEIYLHFCGRAAAWHLAQHRRQQVNTRLNPKP